MAASDYDGRLPEPPYSTDTSAVVALQEECDRLAEQVRTLRCALFVIKESAYNSSHIESLRENLREIRGVAIRALEATKEGA